MKKKNMFLTGIAFFLMGTFSSPFTESATTLKQALAAAYASNPAFAVKRHELKASEASRLSALSEFLPSVLLEASLYPVRKEGCSRTRCSRAILI